MIQLKDISKSYKDGSGIIKVLENLSFSAQSGETVSIMGRSGSGKSTMLHILGGIEGFDGGNYHLDGIDVGKLSPSDAASLRSKKIGLVFQSYYLIKSLDCLGNVELPLGYAGVGAKERRERAAEALAAVGMGDYTFRAVTKLSGGQQQRVAIARAIVTSPSVILADEPTGNLDAETAEKVIGLLVSLTRERGATLIVATHDDGIAAYAESRYVLRDGKVI